MKKLITIAALSATLASQTFAGDREWATVGKVLTGVAVIHVIDRIVNPPTQVVYVHPQPVVLDLHLSRQWRVRSDFEHAAARRIKEARRA